MGSGLKHWLRTISLAFLLPGEIYASDDVTKKYYFWMIAVPVLAAGFLGLSNQFFSSWGLPGLLMVLPGAYIMAAVSLYLYVFFTHTVLVIGGAHMRGDTVDVVVYTSPYLLPAVLILYNPFVGLFASMISFGLHHYMVARIMKVRHKLSGREGRRTVKILLMAEYLLIAVLILFDSLGLLNPELWLGLLPI